MYEVGKHHSLDRRVYLWGVAAHGALGRESYIKPDKKLKQDFVECRQNPQRSEFGEAYKVRIYKIYISVLIKHAYLFSRPIFFFTFKHFLYYYLKQLAIQGWE